MKLFELINNFTVNCYIDTSAVWLAEYIPYLLLLMLCYIFFIKGSRRGKYRNIAIFAVYSALIGLVVNFIIKLFYQHPRPFMEGVGRQLISHASVTSFPSDHATFTFSVGIMLMFFRQTRRWGAFSVIAALLCGVSRVYCGVHFPFDIAGGAVISFCTAFVLFSYRTSIYCFNRKVLKCSGENGGRFLSLSSPHNF